MFFNFFFLVMMFLFANPSFAEPILSPQILYCGKNEFNPFAAGTSPEGDQEKVCLAKYPNLVSRRGKELSLRLTTGDFKKLKSTGKEECSTDTANCMNYFLVGYYSAAKLYFLYLTGYEGSAFLLVNSADGTEFRLEGVPHFAPNGSDFMVIAEGDGDYALAIGELVNNRPTLTWTRATNIMERWNFQGWIDDHHVALKVEGGTICPKGKCERVLTQTGKDWALKVKSKK